MVNANLHVLVLEDDELLQRSLLRLLTRRGHSVTVASTVDEFRERLSQPFPLGKSRPDVLLLDRQVHGKDGWSLSAEAPEGSRVVLMTANAPQNSPPHLSKPFRVDELYAAVEGL